MSTKRQGCPASDIRLVGGVAGGSVGAVAVLTFDPEDMY